MILNQLKFRINEILKNPFLYIIVIGLLIRIPVFLLYQNPCVFNDTGLYVNLGKVLANFDLGNYEGWRTPGYPLLLLLTNFNFKIVILLQSLFDFIAAFLLYTLIKKHSTILAILVSTLFLTFLNIISFEIALLTENLTLCLMVFLIWFLLKYSILETLQSHKKYIYLSVILMVIFLVRPMFIFITPVVAFFFVANVKKGEFVKRIGRVALLVLFPCIAYLSWCGLNFSNNKWFVVTPFYGINLAQNTYTFFYKVPDKHKQIRDIYLRYLDSSDIKGFKKSVAILYASEQIQKETGLSQIEISKQLAIISKELIHDNPRDYFRQFVQSWKDFWYSHPYWEPKENASEKGLYIINVVWSIQYKLLRLFCVLLFPLAIFVTIRLLINKKLFNSLNFIFAIILLGSISQAAVISGENSRFSFPFIPFICMYVLISIYNIYMIITKRYNNEIVL